MSVQNEFLAFHNRIKLDYEVNEELSEKRDILLDIIRNCDDIPSFKKIDQGSYSMHLGTEPLDGKEYDIDVGLRFNVNKDDYEPMELKEKIYDLLKNHTYYGAEIKKPCVTVTYRRDGEKAFHVDLVVYAYDDKDDTDSQMYLAKGKTAGSDETKWEKSDPVGLVDYINNAIEDEEDRKQFRRVVRYMKRWKNLRFVSEGHAEPASIGITLIAADCFSPEKGNDLIALKRFVDKILSLFVCVKYDTSNNRLLYRIKYPMPYTLRFEADTDAFSKMSDIQMTNFRDKLNVLSADLAEVIDEPDELEQCSKLNEIFGDDFEVPEAKSVSKKQYNYIPPTSASGDCG